MGGRATWARSGDAGRLRALPAAVRRVLVPAVRRFLPAEVVEVLSAGSRQVLSLAARVVPLAVCLAVVGCVQQEMADRGRIKPLEASEVYEDGRSARPVIEGTVPRGGLRLDDHLHTGLVDGEAATTFPFEVDAGVLARGRERYDIFCSPCHDAVGNGNGMVVQRGFRRPTSFHVQRLREAAPGYLFDVVTRGFGTMPSYASQVPVRDRWAIVAYVRALQLSQNATLDDVPADERVRLEGQR